MHIINILSHDIKKAGASIQELTNVSKLPKILGSPTVTKLNIKSVGKK